MSADHLVAGQQQGIDLIGPVQEDRSWQAQAGLGFDAASFTLDWDQQRAICPQGAVSNKWSTMRRHNHQLYNFRFPRGACANCDVRAKCTKAVDTPRTLTIQAQPAYEALQAARQRQQQPAFREQYNKRAGVEGTISQGIAIADLRQTRYIGLPKTRLQHILTALGMNILRLGAWWADRPSALTRTPPFARLAPA